MIHVLPDALRRGADDVAGVGGRLPCTVAAPPSGAPPLDEALQRLVRVLATSELTALLRDEGEVLTSYPVEGPGVVQHPVDHWREEPVGRLRAQLDAAEISADVRAALEELMAVGEWPYVVRALRVTRPGDEVEQLAALAGLS